MAASLREARQAPRRALLAGLLRTVGWDGRTKALEGVPVLRVLLPFFPHLRDPMVAIGVSRRSGETTLERAPTAGERAPNEVSVHQMR